MIIIDDHKYPPVLICSKCKSNRLSHATCSLFTREGHIYFYTVYVGLIFVVPCTYSSFHKGLSALGGDLDLSSSDESYHRPNRPHGRSSRSKAKGPSLRDGPEAIAKMMGDKKGSRPQGPATLCKSWLAT